MTFGYGKRPLFEGLDLSLAPGAVYGLLGHNGAGKVEVFGRVPGGRSAGYWPSA
jgi:ATPase subunit of ABC transporter with duplicated ATPase domains